jgi:hypothetical protein
MLVNRRLLIFAATAALALSGLAGSASAAPKGLTWGVNGHPLASYPGIPLETQLEHIRELGLTSYRVDIGSTERLLDLQHLVREAKARGITVLPVITPGFEMDKEDNEVLEKKAYGLAFALVSSFKGEIPVWELGNEMENYAIIQPCEMQDDGKQYSCSYGPAGGVSVNEYFGPRWAKVSAVLKGLTRGARAADPNVKRAVGTAGWGHVGAFARMKADGIEWDISVWHMYGQDPEWAFKELVKYQRPIWVTEFNNPNGSKDGKEAQAKGLTRAMSQLEDLQSSYPVEAAHIYELMDEPYWEDYEAHMGLVEVQKDASGEWSPGARKPAFDAVKTYLGGSSPAALVQRNCQLSQAPDGEATDAKTIVSYAYCLVLGRLPDGAGLTGYAARLPTELSVEQMLAELTRSDEFAKLHKLGAATSVSDYVTLLYQLLLGVEPTEQERKEMVAALQSQPPQPNPLLKLIGSEAFRARHATLFKRVAAAPAASVVQHAPRAMPQVQRSCDLSLLSRPLERERGQIAYSYCLVLGRWPDGHGLLMWVRERRNGTTIEQVLLGMLQSDEFAAKYQVGQLDNAEFVTLLYRLLLDRDPDADALHGYESRLTAGQLSRRAFSESLLTSDEFRAKQSDLHSAKMSEKAEVRR